MTEGTAKRYVELRKNVDDRLAQIRSLGSVIKALGTGHTLEADTSDLVCLGSIIDEMGINVETMLDDFILTLDVRSKLEESKS